MTVYINLQTPALVPCYVAFSNFHLLYLPQIFYSKIFVQKRRWYIIYTLYSPRILIQLAVLQPTNTLSVFLLHFYPAYVSAVVRPSSRYTSRFTSLSPVHLELSRHHNVFCSFCSLSNAGCVRLASTEIQKVRLLVITLLSGNYVRVL
jgi:hypothetical protein